MREESVVAFAERYAAQHADGIREVRSVEDAIDVLNEAENEFTGCEELKPFMRYELGKIIRVNALTEFNTCRLPPVIEGWTVKYRVLTSNTQCNIVANRS